MKIILSLDNGQSMSQELSTIANQKQQKNTQGAA
jgi:hypothetical protein